MSLYGAIFSAVAGLAAQSSKIAILSDNISNANTIGYKSSEGLFQTLVTSVGGGTAYSPGGVISGTRQLVSKQGLPQATASPTDLAISGGGFFVVNQASDGTGQVLYTRAGSFTQDSNGDFRNSGGFFLQAWPLDRDGRLPGEAGNANTISSANLSSLRTVNVTSLTGVAAATTAVSLSANLKASERIFAGTGLTASMDAADATNRKNKAEDIIVPQGSGNIDSLTRGDQLSINVNGAATTTFTYGGIGEGRSVIDGTGGDYGSAVLGSGGGEFTIGVGDITVGNSSNVVTIDFGGAHGLQTGDVISIDSSVAVGGVPAADLQGTFIVTRTGTDTVTIEVATTTGGAGAGANASTVPVDIRPFDDNGYIMDANSANVAFLQVATPDIFSTEALSFTIATNAIANGTATFTYTTATSPNATTGQFNTLTNLAKAINAVDGLTARVADGKLYVSAIDATQDITFTNGKATGTEGADAGEALYGIDWIRELGITDSTGVIAGDSNQFSTMQGLADLINGGSIGVTATITSPTNDSSIFINVDDPLSTIKFSDGDYGTDNVGSVLSALGFDDDNAATLGDVAPGAGTGATTGDLGPAYDPDDASKSMSGGTITPQFSRSVHIFDSLGTGHDINIAFIKISADTWAVEVYAINPDEVTEANGLLASGNITFNGDSSLQSVDATLSADLAINWAVTDTNPEPSTVTINWGTAGPIGTGQADGLSQFDTNYKVNFANQNGAQVGELTGVSIDELGFVIATYSNGETQRLFKVPLASFANPDQLQSISGNVFNQTSASGEVNLAQAGSSGVGKIAPSQLESSNVELAAQLTDMIIAQRAYQANTKMITTATSMLDDLNRAIG